MATTSTTYPPTTVPNLYEIEKQRTCHEYSVASMAKKLGITTDEYENIESGKRYLPPSSIAPSVVSLNDIARILQCSAQSLLLHLGMRDFQNVASNNFQKDVFLADAFLADIYTLNEKAKELNQHWGSTRIFPTDDDNLNLFKNVIYLLGSVVDQRRRLAKASEKYVFLQSPIFQDTYGPFPSILDNIIPDVQNVHLIDDYKKATNNALSVISNILNSWQC